MALSEVIAGAVMGSVQGTSNTAFALRDIWERRHARRREDNAVQRRMADMAAAGINPILAAGDAAASMAPAATHQPETGMAVLGAMTMAQEIRKAKAETDNIRETNNLIKANVSHVNELSETERFKRGITQAQDDRARSIFQYELHGAMSRAASEGYEAEVNRINAENARQFGMTDAQNRSIILNVERLLAEEGFELDMEDKRIALAYNYALKAVMENEASIYTRLGVTDDMARNRELMLALGIVEFLRGNILPPASRGFVPYWADPPPEVSPPSRPEPANVPPPLPLSGDSAGTRWLERSNSGRGNW